MEDRPIRVLAVRIACALALILFGFTGHGLAATDNGPFSAQYRLPDGSYAGLCQTSIDDAGTLPHQKHHCDLCFAAAGHAFVPPQQVAGVVVILAEAGIFWPPTVAAPTCGALRHGVCRGPPLAA